MYDVVIIDPSSTEFNRGSFCYLPYIQYMALKRMGGKVAIMEDFTSRDLDSVPKARQYLVALWSYPQLDIAALLYRFLPMGKVKFFGYTPLVQAYNYPLWVTPDEDILMGIEAYPLMYYDFRHMLLCDDDMHLIKYEGDVFPLFTTYGCKRNCSFCPVHVNCERKLLTLPIEKVLRMINICHHHGYLNIHFTDENLFRDIDRTYTILNYMAKLGGFKLIALSDVSSLTRFIKKYGGGILDAAGVKLAELGFETADPGLAKKMRKDPADKYKRLAEVIDKETEDVNVFWLSMTFFPGETLRTLNTTGEFLAEYGYDIKELYGRIATNSTEGGLGQFFQLYHGTDDYDKLMREGWVLSRRAMRLIPSYLPESFLRCLVEPRREIVKSDLEWFKLYNLDPSLYEWEFGFSVADYIATAADERNIPKGDTAMFLAICARLRII